MGADGQAGAAPAGARTRPAHAANLYRSSITAWITKRPFLVLFAAGALSSASMAPFHLWPVLFFTLPVLFWALTDGQSRGAASGWRSVAWRGWAFGFGYHLVGLHWIGFAFLVQAERFALLMPFALVLLTAGLGLFFCLSAVVYERVARKLSSDLSRILVLALVVMIAEWLRGHILTGFPWNTLGYALTMPLPLMQWAGLFGIYVLSAVVIITLCSPLVVLASDNAQPWRLIGMTTVLPLCLAVVYGYWQLGTNPTTYVDDVRLRIVQPSFTQKEKFDESLRSEIFRRHLELSTAQHAQSTAVSVNKSVRQPTHIIWPEAAIPFFVRRDQGALAAIDRALPDDVRIIAGTFRINVSPGVPNEQVGAYRIFNSAMTLGGDGKVHSIYDKIHLVPFGEYLPMQSVLTALGFENLTRTSGGLALGAAPRRLMRIAGLPPVALLICYEASFPDEIFQGPERPGVLINLTNDAWFGTTTGPYQHLHQTRLRAVEQGVPMIRSANNGVSAVFDPMGRLIDSLPLNSVGVINQPLPVVARMTLYATNNWSIELIVILAMLLVVVLKEFLIRST